MTKEIDEDLKRWICDYNYPFSLVQKLCLRKYNYVLEKSEYNDYIK